MAALTQDRLTPEILEPSTLELPAAAGVVLHAGALAALDAAGNVTPGATATTLKGLGRVEAAVDNGGGSAGAVTAKVRRGVFRFANSAGADEIGNADIGEDCFIVDDQTVAITNGTNTRSRAGRVWAVDAQGVWVDFR
ncbi:hypothetical protein [Algihabitans albus]|uniref:hypothetical protein n=1 Tax=Algihabitans albus TaxID=2164067 RepID=UPI000E5CE36A|nr:hypothetical protein [Algihabitans albus]